MTTGQKQYGTESKPHVGKISLHGMLCITMPAKSTFEHTGTFLPDIVTQKNKALPFVSVPLAS